MEGRFLALLIAEAPVEAFEAPLVEARQRRAGAQEIAQLQADMVAALQLRAVLEERRRREQELAALYATAGDLTALRDVSHVLSAIVRRARQLLGSDTTYLMLIDEQRGDTYMRVTEGTVSAEFERVRLPLGAGLGGLVAKTASPYYTANYHADDRFARVQEVDDAVAAEGLIAILGVPLKLADRVIGVLFAANRRERPFAPQEVALLGSLAAHAAIAIDNARLFEEAQQALRELNAANATVRAHSEAVERAAAAHERLTTVVLHGGGIRDVADAVVGLLGRCLLVTDADGRLLACGGTPQDDLERLAVQRGALPGDTEGGADLRASLAQALSAATTARVGRPGVRPRRWVAPVIAGSERLGALVLAADADLDDADLQTLERAALISALVLLHQRSLAEAEQRVRGELLDELVTRPGADPERLRRQARLLGLDVDAPQAVVVAAAPEGLRRRAAAAVAGLAGDHGGMAGEQGGNVVVLLPGQAPAEAAARVSKRLTALLGAPVTAGGAGPAAGPTAIAEAHQEAERCLRALIALGHEGRSASGDQLGAYVLVLTQSGREEVDRFVRQALGPVLAYDARHGSDLHGTLEAYFAGGGNLTRAAEALHVHVNTLYQRLDRIARLVGEGWREGDQALQLHLALRLHRLRSDGRSR